MKRGRPRMNSCTVSKAVEMYFHSLIPATQIASILGISRRSLYNAINETGAYQ